MGFHKRETDGFFYNHEPPAPKKPTQAAARKAAQRQEKGCDGCALRAVWPRLAAAQMAMGGNLRDADILMLGEAPRPQDDRLGKPFSDEYWKEILNALPGYHRDRIAYQNLVRCAPLNEWNEATPSEVHSCSDHLAADANSLPGLKAIIGIGQAPLSAFFPGLQLREVHGMKLPLKIGEKTVWFYSVFAPKDMRPKAGGWSQEMQDTPQWPLFRAQIRAFFKQIDTWPEPKITKLLDPKAVLLPQSEEEAMAILATMKEGVKGVDIETANPAKRAAELRPYNVGAKIISGAVSDGRITMAFPCQHPEESNSWGIRFLIHVINNHPWIAHNLSFEWAWLKFAAEQMGIEWAPQQAEDSMALVRLMHRRETALGLEDSVLISHGVNVKGLTSVDARHILQYPLHEILPYNGLDAQASVLLYNRYRKKVKEANYRRLVDATRVTANMALLGLPVDFRVSEKLMKQWQARAQQYEDEARKLFEVKAFERDTGKRFQISSGQDVGAVLTKYARLDLPPTPKGAGVVTDEKALNAAAAELEEGHPLIAAVLEYREAAKMCSTYIQPTLEARERCYDQQIHPSYSTMKLKTLRLSCEDPNAQNWPKRDKQQMKLRKQVKAPKGKILYRIDYKALEARVIACATKDRRLCENTIKEVDIHAQWRDRLLKLYPRYIDWLKQRSGQTEYEKILKAGRDEIKTDFVFASFFGATAKACADRTGVPLKHMEHLQSNLWSPEIGYPEVHAWIKNRRKDYKDTGSTWLLTGIERHDVMEGNETINTPIQGSGAMVTNETMIACANLAEELDDIHFHPRIQIHDDLTFILPDNNDLERYIDKINETAVALRFDWQIVPFAVEGAIGYNWCDMEEVCKAVGDYHK